ncbi:MAG: glutarate dioxygenase GlaH [Arenicellales bacterium]
MVARIHASKTNTFTVSPLPENKRAQEIVISKPAMDMFRQAALEKWDVQAIEYKPFLRFAIAEALDQACQHRLSKTLNDILHCRDQAAFVIRYEGAEQDQKDFYVLFATAISHLIGLPNYDAMYGSFYARFTVEHKDNSDSYLRQAYHRLELHNDGTYVDERTDFVLMMKMDEQNMHGGETMLLHLDDWQDLQKFHQHPLAKRPILWGSPKSKNITHKVSHPVFFEDDENGKPHMLFIDQFAEPMNRPQGLYLHEMSESLEADKNTFSIALPIGAMVVIQNHVWLHGRDKFKAHPNLKRELLRQRGHFTD